MKKLIVFTFTFLFAVCAVAQDNSRPKQNTEKYCARTVDGTITMMLDSKELVVDVTLENGTIVRMDGTVIKKDGTTFVLKAGECVNHDGNLVTKNGKPAEPKK